MFSASGFSRYPVLVGRGRKKRTFSEWGLRITSCGHKKENPPVKRVVCSSPIRAYYRPAPKWRWLSLCSSPEPLSLWLPLEGFFILARTQLVPHYVMLFLLTDVITNRHFIESNCTHKALRPKTSCCRICISSLHDYRKLSTSFYFSGTPWSLIRLSWVEYSPTYAHDRA